MKKRFLLGLAMCLMLAGCGKKEDVVHAAVMVENLPIALDAPAAPVLAALGAPFWYGERSGQSGVERTYRFAGLGLKTLESRGGERISAVTVTGGEVRTPEGIALGDCVALVQGRFGADAVQDGRCTIFRQGEKLEILLQNGVVAAISYTLL